MSIYLSKNDEPTTILQREKGIIRSLCSIEPQNAGVGLRTLTCKCPYLQGSFISNLLTINLFLFQIPSPTITIIRFNSMQQIVVGGIPQANNSHLPRVENVSCILTPSKGKGGLYLGNFFGAQNVQNLKQYGIRAVLTTSIETPVNYNPEDIPFHKKIAAHDRQNFSMMEYLDQCLPFIEEYRAVTNVYVHCYAGMSRSTTIVIAYLMKTFRWGYDATLHFVRFKRSIANPNEGFAAQLRNYEKTLGIVPRAGFPPAAEVQVRPQPQVVRQQLPQQPPSSNGQFQNQQGQATRRIVVAVPPEQGDPRSNGMIPMTSPRQPQYQKQPTQMMVPRNMGMQVVGEQRSPPPPPNPTQMLNQMRGQVKTKHDQIPIPRFGNKKQTAKQSPSKHQIKVQEPVKMKEEQKELKVSKAGFIRPKDLPGYRQS